MENGEFNNLGKFEEYRDIGRISGDEGCVFSRARGYRSNMRVPKQYVKSAE
jgi:hypothetical protein